jgi:hypothetical protein
MHRVARRRAALACLAVIAIGFAACDPSPSPSPTGAAVVPSSSATQSPSTAPSLGPSLAPSAPIAVPASFPLAVVTGMKNVQAVMTLDALTKLATDQKLIMPCGIQVMAPTLAAPASCTSADAIGIALQASPKRIALLPPGLVVPATKVLPIAGDGPFGLFGPDLIGGPAARALPYPITASVTRTPAVDPAWLQYDAASTWDLNETGSLCADRGGAKQAVTLGKGWDWVFDGGTAKYNGGPIPNPNPPPGIDRHPIVRPVETGNAGAMSKLISSADVSLGNLKCPALPTKDWHPANQALGLSVPEDVLTRWRDFLGLDAVYLPADHQSDRGIRGIQSTLTLLDKHKFPHTGLGMDLTEALEPAYVEVAGQKIAFVSWDNVPGPTHAAAGTPGVAWLTKSNVNASVRRAKAAGATVIVCDPQWWGPDEYVRSLTTRQEQAVGWMDAAGCDQILAGGLHVSGGLYLRPMDDGRVSVVDTGPGNFQYGQDFWQETQEGVIVELSFRGSTLVNVRLHPYVMLLAARAALLDPAGDGHYVQQRILGAGQTDYLPASSSGG